MIGFSHLPSELIVHIFQFFDAGHTVASAKRVCTQWNSILTEKTLNQVLMHILQLQLSQKTQLKQFLDKYPFIFQFISVKDLLRISDPVSTISCRFYDNEHAKSFSDLLEKFKEKQRSILTIILNEELAFIVRIHYDSPIDKMRHDAVFVVRLHENQLVIMKFHGSVSQALLPLNREQKYIDWLSKLLNKETCDATVIGGWGKYTMY